MAGRQRKIETSLLNHQLYAELLQGYIIRLIEIQPGDRDAPIDTRLLIAELDYAPQYEAISYVWGSTENPVKIRCNGRTLSITRNLDSVLRRVRYPDRPRVIWADAICINQTCAREKSHHVAFMDKVYRQAKRVLAYMGEDENGNASDVKRLIEEYNDRAAAYESITDMPILAPDDPLFNDTKWNSLGTLMGCAWFRRAWVLQEVGVADLPIVLYGDEEFSYRNLMQLSRWVTRSAPGLQSKANIVFFGVHTDWDRWCPDWRETAPYPEYDLLQFYNHTRGLKCKDERDHIYAFLGHPLYQLPDGSGLIIEPDYSQRAEEVLASFTALLFEYFGFRVLSTVEQNEETIKDEYPSWVLRWSEELVQNSFGCWVGYRWDASYSLKPEPTFVAEGETLHVSGFVLDTVSKVYQFPTSFDSMEKLAALRGTQPGGNKPNVLDEIWTDIHNESTPYRYPPGKKTEILSLSLVAGLINYQHIENDLALQHWANFAAYWTLRMHATFKQDPPEELRQAEHGNPDNFHFDMSLACEGRTFIITEKGYYGLGPWITKNGDVCCILQGASVPFVLRRRGESSYKFLGESYIHGVMFGEAAREAGGKWKDIIIQ